MPVKRKQGEKCYFSPCALISKLTTSRKYKKAGRGLEQQLFSPLPVEVKPIILGTPKTLALHKFTDTTAPHKLPSGAAN